MEPCIGRTFDEAERCVYPANSISSRSFLEGNFRRHYDLVRGGLRQVHAQLMSICRTRNELYKECRTLHNDIITKAAFFNHKDACLVSFIYVLQHPPTTKVSRGSYLNKISLKLEELLTYYWR